MPFRPVIIDTPEIASDRFMRCTFNEKEEILFLLYRGMAFSQNISLIIFREISTKKGDTCALNDFLIESQHMQISALCLVLKVDEASISKDGKIIGEVSTSPIIDCSASH